MDVPLLDLLTFVFTYKAGYNKFNVLMRTARY